MEWAICVCILIGVIVLYACGELLEDVVKELKKSNALKEYEIKEKENSERRNSTYMKEIVGLSNVLRRMSDTDTRRNHPPKDAWVIK